MLGFMTNDKLPDPPRAECRDLSFGICHRSFRRAVSAAALRIPQPAYSGHRSSLAQVHIAVVLDVILQPRGDARAASASGISSRRRVGVAIVLGIAVLFGVPVLSVLVTIAATRFPEKERERERNTKTHISGFSRTHGTKPGAGTEEENNFFHRAATLMPKLAHPARKGSRIGSGIHPSCPKKDGE
jgi:hypothetical protein